VAEAERVVTLDIRRYPVDRLAAVLGMTEHAALAWLGITGTEQLEYRRRGLTDYQADRLAVKAGFHPAVIWPELVEDRIRRYVRVCSACSEPFLPVDSGRRHYCSHACYSAAKKDRDRRYMAVKKERGKHRAINDAPTCGNVHETADSCPEPVTAG